MGNSCEKLKMFRFVNKMIMFVVLLIMNLYCGDTVKVEDVTLQNGMPCGQYEIKPVGSGGKTDFTCTVTVLLQGDPVSGVSVNITVTGDYGSGDHQHQAITRPTGTITHVSQVTGEDGKYEIGFSHTIAGIYNITATGCKTVDGTQYCGTDTKTIHVKVPDLKSLPIPYAITDGYTLIGTRYSHPNNHFGSPDVIKKLVALGDDWRFVNGETGALKYNDISLNWGGLFDCYSPDIPGGNCSIASNEWQVPHRTHRTGKNIDISLLDGQTGGPIDNYKFTTLVTDPLYGAIVHPESDHKHLTFTASPDDQVSLGPPYAETPNQTDIDIEFILTQITKNIDGFHYNYVLKSKPNSNLDVYRVHLLVIENNLVTSASSPSGWLNWLLRGVETISWLSDGFNNMLKPGNELTGFSLVSSGLPEIVPFRSRGWAEMPWYPEGEVPPLPPGYDPKEDWFKGSTLGPKPLPVGVAPVTLIDQLIQLVKTSTELGWINVNGISISLWFAKLEKAKARVLANDNLGAIKNLTAFVNEVDAQKDKHLSQEAWGVLKFNAEYIISILK